MTTSFAGRLTTLRQSRGISQYRLALSSGISKSHISRLEAGEQEPSWDTVCKIAGALGVPACRFADEECGVHAAENKS